MENEANQNWNNQPSKKQKVSSSLLPPPLPTADFYGKRKALCFPTTNSIDSTTTTATTSASWLAARTALRSKWRRLSQQHETEDIEQLGVYTAPPPPWKIYRKQQLAFDEADQHNNTPSTTDVPFSDHDLYRIFSVELNNKGKRAFLATSLRIFWNYYKKLQRWQRHYYEIIRENKPCRLYFDLEFYYVCNPHITSTEELMEEFFYQVNVELQTVCGICIQRNQFHDMDSSTSTKFSRHVVVVLPNDQLWRNNIHVGHFVRGLAQRCRQASPMLWLFDHKDDNGTSSSGSSRSSRLFLADLAVYTKNRAFRLYLSSKVSKGISLMPADTNQFQPCDLMDEEGEYNYFCHSLTSGGVAAARTLTKLSTLRLVHMEGVQGNTNARPSEATGRTSLSSSSSSSSSSSYVTVGNNPDMEDLVSFIEARASATGGLRSRVRKIERQPGSNEIILHISGSKYCDNVHRHHKSNHIYYLVNVKDRYYTQKCWDIQCTSTGERIHRKLPNELQLPVPVGSEANNGSSVSGFHKVEKVDDGGGGVVEESPELMAPVEAEVHVGKVVEVEEPEEIEEIEIEEGCNFAM